MFLQLDLRKPTKNKRFVLTYICFTFYTNCIKDKKMTNILKDDLLKFSITVCSIPLDKLSIQRLIHIDSYELEGEFTDLNCFLMQDLFINANEKYTNAVLQNLSKAIQNVQQKIAEIQPGLATKMLPDGTESKLQIVPFYDRSELIYETIATLEDAISLQMLIAVLVVIVLLFNLRASLAISSVLPIAVLMVFIGMMWLDIEANIVALSGIAIAIGTMIDLAVILVENISKHLTEVKTKNNQIRLQKVEEATLEVSGAILTAVATTVVSFIPVFLLENAEGKLFVPLAYTKTFALLASCLVTLFILPSIAYVLLGMRVNGAFIKWIKSIFIGIISLVLFGYNEWFFGALLLGLSLVSSPMLASVKWSKNVKLSISLLGIVWLLTSFWLPLGPSKAWIVNFLFKSSASTGLICGSRIISS